MYQVFDLILLLLQCSVGLAQSTALRCMWCI